MLKFSSRGTDGDGENMNQSSWGRGACEELTSVSMEGFIVPLIPFYPAGPQNKLLGSGRASALILPVPQPRDQPRFSGPGYVITTKAGMVQHGKVAQMALTAATPHRQFLG